ncbi:hypothetical protein D0Y65_036117 [Glycine soja]|uniref:Uncharacterized protein n=1 Tax=Glycine soja TaxID=3848 RepID=A0A445HCX4_GLYSO|nr:hypothetical protein D0Y65_036117 [Glycine soja]
MCVFILLDKMVAAGPRVADFVTEIFIIVQKHTPFNIDKWKQVPEVAKEKIVTKVLAERLYRIHRCRLHQYFKKYETTQLTLENKPNDLSVQD